MVKPATNKSELFSILKRIFWLRNLAILVQLLVIFTVIQVLMIPLPLESLLVAISIATLFNLFMAWRLRQHFPVTEFEIATNLTFDTLILGALLYYTGGSTNPFISLFLVPTALAASFLSTRYVVSIAALSILLYSFLMLNHYALPSTRGRFGGDFNLHVFGMWINFILSSVVVVIFMTELARRARAHALKLAENEKTRHRDEQILSLGTLAAGTAHEISTPLSNIGMLADELVANPQDRDMVSDFARTIRQQQQHCVKQLQQLRRAASGEHPAGASSSMPLKQQLEELISHWAGMRPEIAIHKSLELDETINAHIDPSVQQAINSLLNNAADASLENQQSQVDIAARIHADQLLLEIDDHGKGLRPEQLENAGDIAFTTKPGGFGIGLMLSHASLARYDGRVTVKRTAHGMRTTITLPLKHIIT